jgi:hypothetical protein
MNKLNHWATALFRSPVLWGALVAALYYLGLEFRLIDSEMLRRFTAGHSVEYIVVVAFCIGSAALGLKAADIYRQGKLPEDLLLGPIPSGGQPTDDAGRLLGWIDEAPRRLHGGYLLGRLRELLDHVRRTGNAETLDAELKYLSDLDAVRAQHGYAFVRVIIWAIPILGLLGTVIGITSVFANLKPNDVSGSVPLIVDGMRVAFDTTGLALGLSMMLMFGQYFTDRFENGLLTEVDARTNAELKGRFQTVGLSTDPQMGPIRRMVEAVLQANDRLVTRQAEIWRASIDAANGRFGELSVAAGSQIEAALTAALANGLKTHAETLVATEQQHVEQNARQWSGVQQALVQVAEAATSQQSELTRQTDVLLKVVDAMGQVTQLEDALNRNLAALAGTRSFDDTLVTLGAAVQLLSARLSTGAGDVLPITLAKPRRGEMAA